MIKNFVALEHKVDDRVYQFFCDPNAPLGEIHDAICKMKSYVVDKIVEHNQTKEDSPPKQND